MARQLPRLCNPTGADEDHCSRCSSVLCPSGDPGERNHPGCWQGRSRPQPLHFAKSLKPEDGIVLEATGNTSAIVRLLSPFVARVVVANPNLVRAIAWAKVKTDKIDARVLAKLYANGPLPGYGPAPQLATPRIVVS